MTNAHPDNHLLRQKHLKRIKTETVIDVTCRRALLFCGNEFDKLLDTMPANAPEREFIVDALANVAIALKHFDEGKVRISLIDDSEKN